MRSVAEIVQKLEQSQLIFQASNSKNSVFVFRKFICCRSAELLMENCRRPTHRQEEDQEFGSASLMDQLEEHIEPQKKLGDVEHPKDTSRNEDSFETEEGKSIEGYQKAGSFVEDCRESKQG
ncbi:hypothetical protein B9Z55_027353 [Caenorhabditis nigoni]|uniref:Uncharacterized protein n=1 Tax=Caenorhabditis nigoni TaxID=1611254 RepID=A0A2G5SG95_9PELO|nr:hypothetical protein B9Z55_027353 [Caenorhabditis nigoni]